MNRAFPYKILVVYYTQTGQIKKIIDSVFSCFNNSDITIDYVELKPQPAYPFPWTYDEFFSVFPESVKGVPCRLENLSLQTSVMKTGAGEALVINERYGAFEKKVSGYDLIVIGYQPWYLSPSIPIHTFFQSEEAKEILKGKDVITIIGCRNMWAMAQQRVKEYLTQHNARLVGNIVLRDKAPNLISVLSIVRWLVKGKQQGSGLIPNAGVSVKDIEEASRFGKLILESLTGNGDAGTQNSFNMLQQRLNTAGAVEINPALLMIEKNGHRIFSLWAKFILSKGKSGDKKRRKWEGLFKYYLFFVLFLISPIGIIVFNIIKPFIYKKISKDIKYYTNS